MDAGEIFALLGPNGGGKTTLFRILSTLLMPSEGTVRVFGHDVRTQAAAVRRAIGVVFQSPAIDLPLTVAREPRGATGTSTACAGRNCAARMRESLEGVRPGRSAPASARRRSRAGSSGAWSWPRRC